MWLSWQSVCLVRIRLWVQPLASQKLGMMAHTWNLSTGEEGESEVQSHPWLGNEFEASLDYLRLCLKAKAKTKTKKKNNLCEVLFILFYFFIFVYSDGVST